MIDSLLALVAPHECLSCRAEGALLCSSCQDVLPAVPARCYRCRKVTDGDGRTCLACRRHSKLYSLRAATYYDGVAKDLVWKFKFGHARAAANDIAKMMAGLLSEELTNTVLCHIPTATSRVRQRGFDQAELLAKELSRLTGLSRARWLARHGQGQQVGASRTERQAQLAHAFRVVNLPMVRGAHILLVDDVLTTSATMEAAAAALRAAGARRVSGLVFAQA